jgi:hypothetical protein
MITHTAAGISMFLLTAAFFIAIYRETLPVRP